MIGENTKKDFFSKNILPQSMNSIFVIKIKKHAYFMVHPKWVISINKSTGSY